MTNYEYDTARRQAHADLAEVNRHLADERNRSDPKLHSMLMEARRTAISTLNDLDNIEHNDDYRSEDRVRQAAVNRMYSDTMDAINRLYAEMARRGARNAERVRRDSKGRFADYNDYNDMTDDYNIDMDDTADMDDYADNEMARRKGRGRVKPGPPRDRRLKRRRSYADYNMAYDDYNDDYSDDAHYDRHERADHEKRIADAYARGYADAAAMRMDDHTIYPGLPVMPRQDDYRRSDNRNDARADRADVRADADDNAHDTGRNAAMRR